MSWTVVELSVDQYGEQNVNRRETIQSPDWEEVDQAIRSLDSACRSSMALTGPDDVVMCLGGGRDFYHVYIQFDESGAVLIDPSKDNTDMVDMTIGGVITPLPSNMIVSLANALDAAKEFYLTGALSSKMEWLKT